MSQTANPLGMSDDEFLKLNSSSTADVVEAETQTPVIPDNKSQENVPEVTKEPVKEEVKPEPKPEEKTEEKKDDTKTPGPADAKPNPDAKPAVDSEPNKPDTKPEAKPEEKPENKPDETNKDTKKEETPEAKNEPVDFEGFYKDVMKPFKANGKEIQVRNKEEAIRLMQMGAGYGKKLQDLQPALKTLRMLEKHNLMDESKISFAIDLINKNPDAIKKLIKESGIDPLDINNDEIVNYTPTNRGVSDSEMAFHTALKEAEASQEGLETLNVINSTWDIESKKLLGTSPELIGIIQSQREIGIYDIITAEIDHQKMLGAISSSIPFIQAYKLVGDSLQAAGKFNNLTPKSNPVSSGSQNQPLSETPVKQVLETRAQAVKEPVSNDAQAKAAAPSAHSVKGESPSVNPLAMADDDFLKQFKL